MSAILPKTLYNPSMAQELFDTTVQHPGEILKQKLSEKGWTQLEFAAITGKSMKAISDIARCAAGVSPDMAVAFAAAIGNTPQEWLKWDYLYRLSRAENGSVREIRQKARLHEIAPVKDMQRRGWISQTKDLSELEAELKRFFGCDSLDGDILFPVAARRSETLGQINPAERAWCFRARHLAATLQAAKFSPRRLAATERKLRRLAAYPKEARHLSTVLAEYGIRFLVIEALPTSRIDGVTFWLDDEPVIALSLRYDRIDWFWFTLMHEFWHVWAGDAYSIDTDLVGDGEVHSVTLVEDDAERLANERAADSLISKVEIDSFIRRVGPLYSKDRVIQFAHKVKIHPGIIVGQLQHRREIGYSSLRQMLVKVRDVVVSTALTDGWNQTIAPTNNVR